MDVASHADNILGKNVQFGGGDLFLLALGTACPTDGLQVLRRIQVGHITAVKDIVDVLNHLLVDDLHV